MIQKLGEKWRHFRRRMNALLLAMDADPLADIHRRLRHLETARLMPKACRHRPEPSDRTAEGD